MTAIVPDTMQGALLVSVIDFFLSFLIISGIGFVLSAFPLLNRVAATLARPPAQPEKKSSASPARPPADRASVTNSAGEVAAISAAVSVVMDGVPGRILNIQPSSKLRDWVDEGRLALLGSHNLARKKS